MPNKTCKLKVKTVFGLIKLTALSFIIRMDI